jgi:hypothetical protein
VSGVSPLPSEIRAFMAQRLDGMPCFSLSVCTCHFLNKCVACCIYHDQPERLEPGRPDDHTNWLGPWLLSGAQLAVLCHHHRVVCHICRTTVASSVETAPLSTQCMHNQPSASVAAYSAISISHPRLTGCVVLCPAGTGSGMQRGKSTGWWRWPATAPARSAPTSRV